MFSWCKINTKPLIIAHRGASALAPENSMAAIKKAIEDKAQAVEIDVRITRDKQIVLIHDSRLERTSNGWGKVSDFSLKELQKLDFGSWFHPKFSNEKIVTLNQLFKFSKKNFAINIEIKPQKNNKLIAEKCVQLTKYYNLQKKVLISSFKHALIKEVKLSDPLIATAIIFSPVIHLGKKPTSLALKYNANAIVISKNYLRETMVKEAHDLGLNVFVYTIDNYEDLQRMRKFNVDGIMTNSPKNIYKMLYYQ